MARQLDRFATGAVAGLLATLPMTAVMIGAKRFLSWRSQESLPPTQITRRVLRVVNWHHRLSHDQKMTMVAVNHFAYGTGAGAFYGGLFAPRSAVGALATGVAFGLGVWSVSYFGWLPGVGLYRSPQEDTNERNGLMIAAHIVWGGSLGIATHLLRKIVERQADKRATGQQSEEPLRIASRNHSSESHVSQGRPWSR